MRGFESQGLGFKASLVDKLSLFHTTEFNNVSTIYLSAIRGFQIQGKWSRFRTTGFNNVTIIHPGKI